MTNSSSSYAVSVGHQTAAKIAADILDAGGNAIDAGVAASIALTVLHSEQVQLGGVIPMLVHMADEYRTWCIEGAGRWPAATDRRIFEEGHKGRIPLGILRTVVPAAPDAWITALGRFGTMGFHDVAEPAMNLAKSGFPAHEDLVSCTAQFEQFYRRYEGNASIWLPGGKPVQLGQNFIQSNLATTLTAMMDADRKAAKASGRLAGLQAVRDLFYNGDIADIMIKHVKVHEGWLSHDDLGAHHTPVVAATSAPVFDGEIFTAGCWSQGPVLTQILQLLQQAGSTSSHTLIEAIKLAMADRDAYYGDPDFITAPMAQLLSSDYAARRAGLINGNAAFTKMPPAGDIPGYDNPPKNEPQITEKHPTLDTSVAAIIDKDGNVFCATPSDSSIDAPVVPGLGFVISTRGSQSYVAKEHPASIQPGKRPRVSACPMIFRGKDGGIITGGGPGADLLVQAMAQILTGHLAQGLSLQEAVAAPRLFTQTPPHSTDPHFSFPGKITVEDTVAETDFENLKTLGHLAVRATPVGISSASVCLAAKNAAGVYSAVGDPRRSSGQITR